MTFLQGKIKTLKCIKNKCFRLKMNMENFQIKNGNVQNNMIIKLTRENSSIQII